MVKERNFVLILWKNINKEFVMTKKDDGDFETSAKW